MNVHQQVNGEVGINSYNEINEYAWINKWIIMALINKQQKWTNHGNRQ